MKPRPRYVVGKSWLTGFAVFDTDACPIEDAALVHQDIAVGESNEHSRARCLAKAKSLCAMLNREDEMREAVDGAKAQGGK